MDTQYLVQYDDYSRPKVYGNQVQAISDNRAYAWSLNFLVFSALPGFIF